MLQAVAPINYGNIVSGSGSVPTSGSYFYARFTGLLVPLVTGQYTVGVNCQDGCNLFIGEQALVSNLTNKDTAYGAVEYTESGTIYLSAGLQYPITLEWAVGVGGASVGYELQLIWTPPATSTPVLIPATCLTNDTTSITGVLDSSWWNGTLALYYPTGNATIDFANTQHFNKTLDYISDGLTRRILGGSGGFGAATAATATANVATAPADDVIIADGHGNVEDSGVLLSSLVTASELSSYGFFVNPMTASGDMIYEDPSLGPMRLPIGAEGYVMTVVSGLPAWTAGGGGGFANPMTTEGDMIYENASLGPMRLPIGASGYVMTVVGGIPAWAAASGGGGGTSSALSELAVATGGRTAGTVYQNTTGSTMIAIIVCAPTGGNGAVGYVDTNSSPALITSSRDAWHGPGGASTLMMVIPNNSYYKVVLPSGGSIPQWREFGVITGSISASSDLGPSGANTRVDGTTYQNTSGSLMIIQATYTGCSATNGAHPLQGITDSSATPTTLVWDDDPPSSSSSDQVIMFVLPGDYYIVTAAGNGGTLATWYEYTWSGVTATRALCNSGPYNSRASASAGAGATPYAPIVNAGGTLRWLQIYSANGSGGDRVFNSSESLTYMSDAVTSGYVCTVFGPAFPGWLYQWDYNSGSGFGSPTAWWEWSIG